MGSGLMDGWAELTPWLEGIRQHHRITVKQARSQRASSWEFRMSCEESRFWYFERVAASGGALAGALGGEAEARAVLEQIFNTARSDGTNVKSPLQQNKAAKR